jgi:hypothetical protein
VSALKTRPSLRDADTPPLARRSVLVSLTTGTVPHNTKTPLTVSQAAYLVTTDMRGISVRYFALSIGLGSPNLVESIGTFSWMLVISKLSLPSSQENVNRNGNLIPPTSR